MSSINIPYSYTSTSPIHLLSLYVFCRNHIINAVTSPINHWSQCFRKLVVVGLRRDILQLYKLSIQFLFGPCKHIFQKNRSSDA